jgi:hypothetical protein
VNRLSLLLAAAAIAGWNQDQNQVRSHHSYLGKRLPPLSGEAGDWLNARTDSRLEDKSGRTLLVVFTSVF